MTSIHSAWFLDHLSLAEEAAADKGETLTPALRMLTSLLAHTAYGGDAKHYANAQVTMLQIDAARMTGIGERSIQPLFATLVDIGILASPKAKRYALGPFWQQMDELNAVFRFKRDKATPNDPLIFTRWIINKPDGWSFEHDRALLDALEDLPGVDSIGMPFLTIEGLKPSRDVYSVIKAAKCSLELVTKGE